MGSTQLLWARFARTSLAFSLSPWPAPDMLSPPSSPKPSSSASILSASPPPNSASPASWFIPFALLGPHPVHIRTSSILANIALGIAGSGLAYLLYYSLLDRISSTRVVSVTYLLPIWGLFWGSIAHERIGAPAYIGVAIVIFGLYLLNRKGPAKKSLPQVNADSESLETCPQSLDA